MAAGDPAHASTLIGRWLSPASTARLRLWTGLLLYTFLVTHLLNHALGLHSLAAMEAGREVFLAVWRSPPLDVLLLSALVLHPVLALRRLWRRGSLRMPLIEAMQLVLGLTIPFYLTVHVLGTRGLSLCCGLDDTYTYFVDLVWPRGADRQITMLLIAWTHGSIGFWFWLRLKPAWPRLREPFAAFVVLLPTLAISGFLAAGREVARLEAEDPTGWRARVAAFGPPPEAVREAFVYEPEGWILTAFTLAVTLLLLARVVRWLVGRRRRVKIAYDGGQTVSVPAGLTLLEASRVAGIPHASICGGRGRCSTCRVRVLAGLEHLPPPDPAERRVLRRISAEADVRLACQIRPTRPLTVARLMPVEAGAREILKRMDPNQGREREIAVLFADLRGFTRFAEGRLPYDTVFVLNRYFAAMGHAVERAGGRVDKFIGDGIMALFGLEDGPEAAAEAALRAARAMAEALAGLNEELKDELPQPLRMAMGLHLGPAIVGEMGYGRTVSLTAVGDTVNVASRLEALAKELGVQLVVSTELLARAGLAIDGLKIRAVEVRGRRGTVRVAAIADPADLPLDGSPEQATPSLRDRVLALLRAA